MLQLLNLFNYLLIMVASPILQLLTFASRAMTGHRTYKYKVEKITTPPGIEPGPPGAKTSMNYSTTVTVKTSTIDLLCSRMYQVGTLISSLSKPPPCHPLCSTTRSISCNSLPSSVAYCRITMNYIQVYNVHSVGMYLYQYLHTFHEQIQSTYLYTDDIQYIPTSNLGFLRVRSPPVLQV